MSYLGGSLNNLAPGSEVVLTDGLDTTIIKKSHSMNFVMWFLGLTIILILILWMLAPTWVQAKDLNGYPTGQLNWFNLVIIAAVIALVAVAVIYMVRG